MTAGKGKAELIDVKELLCGGASYYYPFPPDFGGRGQGEGAGRLQRERAD